MVSNQPDDHPSLDKAFAWAARWLCSYRSLLLLIRFGTWLMFISFCFLFIWLVSFFGSCLLNVLELCFIKGYSRWQTSTCTLSWIRKATDVPCRQNCASFKLKSIMYLFGFLTRQVNHAIWSSFVSFPPIRLGIRGVKTIGVLLIFPSYSIFRSTEMRLSIH